MINGEYIDLKLDSEKNFKSKLNIEIKQKPERSF